MKGSSIKKVSILGCGWVGKVLYGYLLPTCNVYCLSKDIAYNQEQQLYVCDVLVIAVPPREANIEAIAQALKSVGVSAHIILLSSISYYDNKPLVVDVEKMVKQHQPNATILRLGGLMGYDRIAGKYTAGKLLPCNTKTHYVHRDDVVYIIGLIILHEVEAEIFDVVAPIQTTKEHIFTLNSKRFGFQKTKFLTHKMDGKELNSDKLTHTLGYTFKKRDVTKFWEES